MSQIILDPPSSNVAATIQAALDAYSDVAIRRGDVVLDATLKLNSGQRLRLDDACRVIRDFTGVTLRNVTSAAGAEPPGTPDSDILVEGGEFTIASDARIGRHWEFNYINGLVLRGSRFTGVSGVWNTYIQANDVRISDLDMDSGDQLGEDGLHIVGGRGYLISNCIIKCGDDMVAIGASTDTRWPLSDIQVNGIWGKSYAARVLAIFAENTTYAVNDIDVSNIHGIAVRRGIAIEDTSSGGGLVERIRVSRASLDFSSPTHYGCDVLASKNIRLDRIAVRSSFNANFHVLDSDMVWMDQCDALAPVNTGQQNYFVQDSSRVNLTNSYGLDSKQFGVNYNNVQTGLIAYNVFDNPLNGDEYVHNGSTNVTVV